MKAQAFLEKNVPSLEGKRFLITGASAGIGLEAAKMLLRKSAEVTFAVRNVEKTKSAIACVENEFGHPVHALIAQYDQADSDSIASFAACLPDKGYDAIVFNAGVYFPDKELEGKDGNAYVLQVNAIGTALLFDALYSRFPNAKYIFTTSIAAKPLKKGKRYQDYFHRPADDPIALYALSKQVAMNIFEDAISRGAKAYLTHPGLVNTGIVNRNAPLLKRIGNALLYPFGNTAEEGALGIVMLCAKEYPIGSCLVPKGLFEIRGYPHEKDMHVPAKIGLAEWKEFFEAEKCHH